MKITKLGHCALVLEMPGLKLLTDPGSFTVGKTDGVTGLDAILITHEHQDHFHLDSLKIVLKNNPSAAVVCNASMRRLLDPEGIVSMVVGDGQGTDIKGVAIEGFGKDHAVIFKEVGLVENTGYMVANQFYFPGDAFYAPDKAVDVLALPVAGPWMKIGEALEFALAVKPRAAFGVHDGMIRPEANFGSMMAQNVLGQGGITYTALKDGESREF